MLMHMQRKRAIKPRGENVRRVGDEDSFRKGKIMKKIKDINNTLIKTPYFLKART
jgi:hypothetical protein